MLIAAALLGASHAGAEQSIPVLTARVVDQTNTLNQSQITSLNEILNHYEERKGTQLAVLIVKTTAPESIEQYSIRVAEQWKIGQKKVDDGVILIIAKDDRAIRIEVGYGLEGILTDALSKRIIDQTIVPRFRVNDFYGGISEGVSAVMQILENEPLPYIKSDYLDHAYLPHFFTFVIILSLVISRALRMFFNGSISSLLTGSLVMIGAWLILSDISITLFAGILATAISFFEIFFVGGQSGSSNGFRGRGGGFGGGGASGKW